MKAKKQYEYDLWKQEIASGGDHTKLLSFLNRIGAEGWSLAASSTVEAAGVVTLLLFLQREIQPDPDFSARSRELGAHSPESLELMREEAQFDRATARKLADIEEGLD